MRVHLDRKLARVASRMPVRLLRRWLGGALDGLELALCLHRIRPPCPAPFAPGMSMAAEDVDALVELLLSSRTARSPRWLTLTFDDGYADAAEYVASRARRFAEVDFVLFVCAEKAEVGAGFRWDLAELARRRGAAARACARLLDAPADVERENAREDLRDTGAEPEFRLASPDELRALLAHPNVALGDHTNCHLAAATLAPRIAARELEASAGAFARLFGAPRHFAFPFGDGFFDGTHVDAVRARGDTLVWGTGQRPYASGLRRPGALLSRIVVDGRVGVRGAAGAIVARALLSRVARGA